MKETAKKQNSKNRKTHETKTPKIMNIFFEKFKSGTLFKCVCFCFCLCLHLLHVLKGASSSIQHDFGFQALVRKFGSLRTVGSEMPPDVGENGKGEGSVRPKNGRNSIQVEES